MPEEAERKITPNEPRTSKESHLREYWRLITEEGKTPHQARGSRKEGDETRPRYQTLMALRKADECPYGDEESDLREIWLHFQKEFPVTRTRTDADYLKEFARRYDEKQDLRSARGSVSTYLFKALKKIVDEDLHFPELAEEEALLKRVWKHDVRRWTENSVMTHLQAFIDEYETNGGDFNKARGAMNSARYEALRRLNHTKAEAYEEPYRSHIKKLQDVWEGNEPAITWEEHLQAFIDEYETNGGDFNKARGAMNSARYQMLYKLNKANADAYEEPYRSHIKKLQEVWETPDVTTWKEHLQAFIDEYETNGGDFVKARGANSTARYQTLLRLNNVKAEDYEEPYRSHIKKLQEVWGTSPDIPDPLPPSQEEDFEDFLLQMRGVSICEDRAISPETNQLEEAEAEG